jgi:RNA polymerase sigma-70 factor (subfamily 1)
VYVELATPVWPQPISRIVAFGDSLSDTGNVFAATGTPAAPYYQGRYGSGPVWVERIATDLGVPTPTPSLGGGTDNAWGGAETGSGSTAQGVPNIRSQVSSWLACNTPGPTDLITVWGGANDFFDGKTDPTVPVANLKSAVTSLAGAGGRRFVVPDLPQLGLTPGALSILPAQRDALNGLTRAFDADLKITMSQLQSSLPGVRIVVLDVDGILQQVRANPSQYGITNVVDSALANGVVTGQGYLIWDDVHPTTVGHSIIGDTAFAAVPEPTSSALTGATRCWQSFFDGLEYGQQSTTAAGLTRFLDAATVIHLQRRPKVVIIGQMTPSEGPVMSAKPVWAMEHYRPLLHTFSRRIQLDPRLRRRFDSSDLVQESLLRAHAALGQFRGRTEYELIACLRAIVERVAIDQERTARAGKRDPALEKSLHTVAADSAAWLDQLLVADGPSPSSAAQLRELKVRLAVAIDQLPVDLRDAIILRDLLEESIDRIAKRLGKSKRAVAGLMRRGRRQLRELLSD